MIMSSSRNHCDSLATRPSAAGPRRLALAAALLAATLLCLAAAQPPHFGSSREIAARILRELRAPRVDPPPVVRPGGYKVYPLPYAIPEEHVVEELPEKELDFSEIYPNSDYNYSFDATAAGESAYHREYRRARFCVTYKKNGWEALRHYEILGDGCVPYFLDLDCAPGTVLVTHPKAALLAAQSLPGLGYLTLERAAFDEASYREVAGALLRYTRERLTTRELARYVLRVSGNEAARSALLILGWFWRPNYSRELLLHGFRKLMGPKAVDDVEHWYMYARNDGAPGPAGLGREHIHGYGFTFGYLLREGPGEVDRGNLSARIRAREFDVVVYANAHRAGESREAAEPRFWGDVSAAYPPSRILFVDGDDEHEQDCWAERAFAGRGWFFRRELRESGEGGDECPYFRFMG
eukprot:tig00021494_g21925.t1